MTFKLDDALAVDQAAEALCERDDTLGRLIAAVGPMRLRLERERFRMLIRAILSQQISVAAAKSIRLRFERLMAPNRVTAKRVAELTDDAIRSAGVTRQKTRYIKATAEAVVSRHVKLSQMHHCDDEAAIAELTKLLGIGRWTAEMFLMFALGRPDIFSIGDLGLRNAVTDLYGLTDHDEIEDLAASWAPYRSVASWYLWRHVDVRDVTDGLDSYPV